jgi:hypothetical protein
MSVLSKQPRGVFEILSASFELYTEVFSKLIVYSLVVFAINQLMTQVIVGILPADAVSMDQAQVAVMTEAMPKLLLFMLLDMIIMWTVYGAMLYRIDNAVHDRADDLVSPLLAAVKKIPALIIASILYFIAVMLGSILIIPGIIFMVSLMFCWVLVIVEDLGGFEALKTSHRLVWGDWWRTNLVFFLPIIGMVVLFGVMGGVMGIIISPASPAFSFIFGLIGTLLAPYLYSLIYLQYHDLKLRKNM